MNPNRAFQVSNVYEILSQLEHVQGKDAQAEKSALQAVQAIEDALGPLNPQIQHPLERLALLYKDEGKNQQGEQAYKRLLFVTEKARADDVHVVMILEELIKLTEAQGQLAEAEPYHLRVIQFWDKRSQPDAAISARANYAALLRKLNREPEATALDNQIKEIRLKQQFANLKDSDIAEMKSTLTLRQAGRKSSANSQ